MKSVFKNLLALIIGLILSAFVIEIILRIHNPFDFRVKGDKIVLPTNFNVSYQNDINEGLDSLITHSKNSIGFRGPEKPENIDKMTSVLAVGGSTTECYYISDGKDWVSLLGETLSGTIENLWVNNAGLDGHSTFGHNILLTDYLIDLNPDYILYLVGCNDVGRKDLSDFDKSFLKKNTNWKSKFKNNSEFASLLVNLNRNLKAATTGLGHHAGMEFEEMKILDNIEEDKVAALILRHQQHIQSFHDRLSALVKKTKINQIDPILITQPTLVGEGIDPITGIDLAKIKYCNKYGGRAYWELLESYNDATRNIAKTENVFLIDLADSMPKSTELYYDCFHFTNKGAQKVAEIIHSELAPYFSSKLSQDDKLQFN